MKFLVYGVNGWIGGKVFKLLQSDDVEVVAGNSRVNDIVSLEEEIVSVKPTHVISLIGRTHGTYNGKVYGTIDYLEQPGKLVENVRDNLFSPMVLSLLSKKYNFHFTYLGTGCIFEFDKDHPFGIESDGFTEESLPNFFGSSYSIVKGFTDQLMHLVEDSVLNVRIRMPITDEFNSRNFITKITNYEKICSVPNSMTVLNELLPLMIDMAKKNITGTVNLTNPGLISHNEILEMYREIVDPDFKWQNFTIDEQRAILDSGRSNNYLETDMLENLYPSVMNIKDSVRNMLIKMKENKV
jgi:nucleoside-diphosphate-sugar epimerase